MSDEEGAEVDPWEPIMETIRLRMEDKPIPEEAEEEAYAAASAIVTAVLVDRTKLTLDEVIDMLMRRPYVVNIGYNLKTGVANLTLEFEDGEKVEASESLE